MNRAPPLLIGVAIAIVGFVILTGAGGRIVLLGGAAAILIAIVGTITLASARRTPHKSSEETISPRPREDISPATEDETVSSPRRGLSPRGDILFTIFFGLLVASAVAWLLLGLIPALAASVSSWHDRLHEWGRGRGVISEVAENMARASHGAGSPGQVVLDYAFSVFNIGLGLFLIYLRPREVTARLLAVGLIGTSVAFNLQGHDAFQVLPASALSLADVWHLFIHLGAGVAYIYALLLFPTGTLLRNRHLPVLQVPFLIFATLAAAFISVFTVDDHVVGLVVVFGLVTPIAGVSSQLRRFRRAQSPRERQQSKLLVWALVVSLGAAAILMISTTAFGSETSPEVERDYEFTTPPPGTYFFRCDPHPATMKGEVIVGSDGGTAMPPDFSVTAVDGEFTKDRLVLPANQQVTLEFTNKDGDLHNVAIYESASAETPLFIGAEFSGRETAIFAFRVFRILFAVIPIALLVGLVHFKLWEIDRVINRALVYTTLSGILAAIYFGLILLLNSLFFSGGRLPYVVVAGSTIGVGALFRPLRDRIQGFIDRRFYRSKYNATKIVDAFSHRVREHINLETLTKELLLVVDKTMQPKEISLWIRPTDDEIRAQEPKGMRGS